MDISMMAVGQAMALRTKPNSVAPNECWRRFEESPKTLRDMPIARRIHGALWWPDRAANPPTISPRSNASPMG